MFNQDQELNVRIEAARLVASAGVPASKLIEFATTLSEWMLTGRHSLPCSGSASSCGLPSDDPSLPQSSE